jgi:hypothetical protein
MKQIKLLMGLLIALFVLSVAQLMAQQVKTEPSYFGGPVTCFDKLNVSEGKLMLGGVTLVTTNTFGGNLTVGNLTVSTNVTVAGTLAVTGVATLIAKPKLTTTNAPGAVVASVLNNLPTGATTNALFFTITVGATSYAVPMYALP